MKSSQKSRATVPQRLMFKEGRKVGRKSVLCTGKDLQVGGGRTRGSREGGIERTQAAAEEGCFGENERG